MADGAIKLPGGAAGGPTLDTSELTVGANVVERERMIIADDSDAAGVAKVQKTNPSPNDYGVSTRAIPGVEEQQQRRHDEAQLLASMNAQLASPQRFARERVSLMDRRGNITIRGTR